MLFLLYVKSWFLAVLILSSSAASSDTKVTGDQNCDITSQGACHDPQRPQSSIAAASATVLPSATGFATATNLAFSSTPRYLPSASTPRKRNEIDTTTKTVQAAPLCTVDPNPDIAGIAIRIAFYITASLSVFFPGIKNLLLALGAGALSIEIAALDGLFKRTLSRYHTFIIRTYLSCSVQILMVIGIQGFWEHVLIALVTCVKSAWIILTVLDVDGGGSNPDCNRPFHYPPLPFIALDSLSDRANRAISVALEIFYLIGALFVMQVQKRYPTTFVRLKTTWAGTILLLLGSVIPAITAIESWIRRHEHFVGYGESSWLYGQIVTLTALLPITKEIFFYVKKRVRFDLRRGIGKFERLKVD